MNCILNTEDTAILTGLYSEHCSLKKLLFPLKTICPHSLLFPISLAKMSKPPFLTFTHTHFSKRKH